MTALRRAVALAGSVALLATSLLPGFAPAARAADPYTLTSNATYTVDPDAGEIHVAVKLVFTNTTPDPSGRFSVFDELQLAVHDQATEVTASDADGELDASVAENDDGVTVATVELRDGLRYEDSVTVNLGYVLTDGNDPQLRIRPSVVVFPAWSFGTAGRVSVDVPAGYEVRVDGDPLTSTDGTLRSGRIDDPSAWLALVTAIRPGELTDVTATVPLDGGTADLLVRAFSDDEAWGKRIRDLVAEALPRLETEIGLPYPHIGQLVLTESVASTASAFGEEDRGGTEIPIAFDQPDFTALHQVAHVWLSPTLVEARWIREGLASHVAAAAAAELDVEPPYDPAQVASDRAESALPLDSWRPGAGPDVEAYGYAASWAFIDQLEGIVGADALRAALQRVAASVGPYEGSEIVPDVSVPGATPATPLSSRSFLDQLEAVSDADLGTLFAQRVLTEADAALLPARTDARDGFAALVRAADGWGAPDPLRAAMAAWSFEEAQRQIQAARAWLTERDSLLAEMEAADLSAPDRLQQAYRTSGGGAEAMSELSAERAVVQAYASTAADANAPHSFLERVGLIGGADPGDQLALANGHFTDGDLRGALNAISEAQRIMAAAETGGLVRLVSLGLIVVALAGAALVLFRRRAAYTSAR